MSLPVLDLASALKVLRQFLCLDRIPVDRLPDAATIQAALAEVAEASDYQIFGVCADDLATGQLALYQYMAALGYGERPEIPAVDGAIYIKYNPKMRSCHAEAYEGQHRGVLVSCQSAYEDGVNETFGHLPLDLFARS
ncbi:MAG: hypothetical protein B0A82_08025 [Alkalinema sp. CACIAM 70d]|nr:MAG: hypothetical protein B0A82_08025 [Alkalinema sp. CACIAM 70d]